MQQRSPCRSSGGNGSSEAGRHLPTDHPGSQIAGFPQGKAPLDQIKKQYKSNVREEMVQHQLPEFFRTALIEQKIDPVAQPQITHLQLREGLP